MDDRPRGGSLARRDAGGDPVTPVAGTPTRRELLAGTAARLLASRIARAAPARAAAVDAIESRAGPFALKLRCDSQTLLSLAPETADGDLVLRFTIRNRGDAPVEVGGLGLPMLFDNILTGRSLEQAHEQASFADPYMGMDAGYLQVTRLNGSGPALLVLPEPDTPFENWRPIQHGALPDGGAPLLHDRTPRRVTFEGFHSWMAASAGFADKDCVGAEQWNPPSSFSLAPGASRTVGVRFVLAPAIRGIERPLEQAGRPVAVGVQGYVVAADQDAALFLKSPRPLVGIDVAPAGAVAVTDAGRAGSWRRFTVAARKLGRARVTLRYAGGRVQTVQYFVTRPAVEQVRNLGAFLFSRQWYENPDDRFGRSPSVMGYDRERGAIVLFDRRVHNAGLSDEGGAGPWLSAIMKQLHNPDAPEIARFERFHVEVIERHLQVPDGPQRYGVRKSLFHCDPARAGDYDPDVDWSRWPSWKIDFAHRVDRSYNYPHVAAAQWVLYRLARHRVGLVKEHDWRWYLDRAFRTTMAMTRLAPEHARFGQMEGDVFVEILRDLKNEGMSTQAAELEAAMRVRARRWSAECYPFGSEMPWDSTGQDEVYAWMRWFGDDHKAVVTREAILGYDPTMPHWGYNGSARRYWDFRIAGELQREERQLHHYGSSLNAIPLFESFRRDPDDFHLSRVAYGGLAGSLTNIDPDGFGSCGFHAWPDALRFDNFAGDYGPNSFGQAYAAASYLVKHPEFGWLGFGGRVTEASGAIALVPTDSARARSFVAPARLWIELDAGRIERVDFDPATGRVRLTLAPADAHSPKARLKMRKTAGSGAYHPAGDPAFERGGWTLPLGPASTLVTLIP